jgi:tRNA pseudouridine38-40 synthase
MSRYQVVLAYDGTEFQGSQRQAKSDGLSSPKGVSKPRTVQGVLEGSLRKLGWTGKSVILAGRTDTGVHAAGQVAAFDMDWVHADGQLLKALNADLPRDLAIRELRQTTADFHPRFDATARRYRYRLFCEPIRDPLRERFLWRVWPEIDASALKQAACLFVGTHDFAAFGSPMTPGGTTVRTVTEAEWKKMPEGEWQFEVRADAFLYRMVRRLVLVQVAVAQGRSSAAEIRDGLTGRRDLLSGLAPANGLTLIEVLYGTH